VGEEETEREKPVKTDSRESWLINAADNADGAGNRGVNRRRVSSRYSAEIELLKIGHFQSLLRSFRTSVNVNRRTRLD